MTPRSCLTSTIALTLAWASLAHADFLTLTPTDDSYIRASQGNQGGNALILVGDTANADDFLRTALAFDLSAPELTNAIITGVTLTLTINDRDSASGGSANLLQAVDLHPLSAPFTNNGVTWFSRDGSNNWTTPGGDLGGGVLASVNANAGTVNGGDTLVFSSTALTASVESAVGGSIYLLSKLAVEDANRSVFRFASSNNSNASYRPRLTITYEPFVNDPDLRQDLATGDWNLAFGVLTGDPPVSATRTLRFTNEGPENPITIESATLSGGGAVFTLDDVAVNGSGGQSPPFTLQVGDSLALTVSATADTFPTQAEATLTLLTSDVTQDRVFPASASFLLPGSSVPHPAIPGTPASAAYQVRIDGVPVPVNDESYFDFHTTFFSMDEPTMVEVEFLSGVSYASIHPLRHGIRPKIDGNKISFPLLRPLKLVVKANGALPLAICATPHEVDVPAPGDPDVIYFGPGTHEPGLIEPVSGQSVYLAPGALVKGRIEVRDATDVIVHGRGTLDSRGYSVRADKTHCILFERCQDVHIDGIGIRGGSWWMTLFLVTNDASATHLSLFGKTVNTDGIDIDGVQRFVARDCFIRCEDDGFGWHALDAEANGEPPTKDCLAEDCVIWNTRYGNGLRVGASMETELFENITFRNIDVLEHAGAAIYADHSDWATCRNIRYENFTDETNKLTVNITIAKTGYSNNTGFRDERGHYDGLHFINLNSPGGAIVLNGYDADHLIDNVFFRDCYRGTQPIAGPGDITTNNFVTNVTFEVSPQPPLETEGFQVINAMDGWISLSFASRYRQTYTLEASSDLGITDPFTGQFQTLGSGPSTEMLFHDPAAVNAPRRFYRIAR